MSVDLHWEDEEEVIDTVEYEENVPVFDEDGEYIGHEVREFKVDILLNKSTSTLSYSSPYPVSNRYPNSPVTSNDSDEFPF